MSAQQATIAAWVVFWVSWLGAALWADRASARPSFWSETPYRLVSIAGVYLLFAFASADSNAGWKAESLHEAGVLARPFWTISGQLAWLLFGVTVAGFCFCWWARLHLGRLWSGNVTRKADHRIIDTGPYAIVRHPIYTGVSAACLAMAGFKGTWVALVGAAIVVFGCWVKARLEERFLRDQLGSSAYDSYRGRTPMLIPLLRRRY